MRQLSMQSNEGEGSGGRGATPEKVLEGRTSDMVDEDGAMIEVDDEEEDIAEEYDDDVLGHFEGDEVHGDDEDEDEDDDHMDEDDDEDDDDDALGQEGAIQRHASRVKHVNLDHPGEGGAALGGRTGGGYVVCSHCDCVCWHIHDTYTCTYTNTYTNTNTPTDATTTPLHPTTHPATHTQHEQQHSSHPALCFPWMGQPSTPAPLCFRLCKPPHSSLMMEGQGLPHKTPPLLLQQPWGMLLGRMVVDVGASGNRCTSCITVHTTPHVMQTYSTTHLLLLRTHLPRHMRSMGWVGVSCCSTPVCPPTCPTAWVALMGSICCIY